MNTPNIECDLDFFAGGVPPGATFHLELVELEKLLQKSNAKLIGNALEEVTFIGAISYFEAFFKNAFASLINIAPSLIGKLKAAGYEVRIDPFHVLELKETVEFSIGFLIAEQIDFGNAKKINSLFGALVGVTPFSKKRITEYNELLADRNLLVHHGGIYTTRYLSQKNEKVEKSRVYMDSLVIDKGYVLSKLLFFKLIAENTVKACHSALEESVSNGEVELKDVANKALFMYSWWPENGKPGSESNTF